MHQTIWICLFLWLGYKLLFLKSSLKIYSFNLEREERRQKGRDRERNINRLPPIHAWTGNQTSNLLTFWCTVWCSNQLSHSARLGYKLLKGRDQICLIHSPSPEHRMVSGTQKRLKKILVGGSMNKALGHAWKLDWQHFPFSLLNWSLERKGTLTKPNATIFWPCCCGLSILVFPSSSCFWASYAPCLVVW